MDSQRNYDVFLSFRGADTRKGFTDHLYYALQRAGIQTFRDDNEIENGVEIGEACLKAIEDSKFSIVVLSKRYASSSWCLDELVHMLKCRKEMGQQVWPVSYDVDDLSDVEEFKGRFGEAFEKMVEECRGKVEMQRVEGWKAALKDVCNMKVWELQKHEDGHEARNIDKIVKDILSKLGRLAFELPPKLIGVDSHAKDVISLMAEDACVVGICGMPGIGKTTIAKKVYNLLNDKFSGSCFLENIKKKLDPEGIAKLQRQLLTQTLDTKCEKIYNVDHGLYVIKERLRNKQVLIVLDDIDDANQVRKILGSVNWLYQGSRVIIITRQRNLMQSKIYREYMVDELNELDAMQLLCLHAFDVGYPIEGYESCAFEVMQYVGGIPLALEILGCSLQDESINSWKCRLEKLKVFANPKIQQILQVSFESLDDADKFLFLDIACFFVGKQKDYVFNILEGCNFFSLDGINTLMKKCLLKFYSTKIGSSKYRLWMHNLVRDMAREMVRQECPTEPGERSRIWKHAEVINVLTYETGTKAVEGITLDESNLSDTFNTNSFKEMKRLRLLQLNYARLSGSFDYVSKQLCWLCWRHFPLDSIPTDLDLRSLIVLDMRYSKLKIFSADMTVIKNLKVLILSHSHELTCIPNFKCMPKLESLILKGCNSLAEVHDSIKFLIHLLSLNLKDCNSLQNLPRTIGDLRSLKSLNITGCSNIENLPDEVGGIKSLVELIADGTSISTLPESIRNHENLEILSLVGCCQVFHSENRGLSVSGLTALKDLNLSCCWLTDDTFPQDLGGLPFLEKLILDENNFINLPTFMGSLPKLGELSLCRCKNLKSVPMLGSSLWSLIANDCPVLESVDLSNPSESFVQLGRCYRLIEMKGFFNLEASRADCHMINFITREITEGGWVRYHKGSFNIFTEKGKIPSWFCHQNTGGDTICFNVPPLYQGSKFVGLFACAIYPPWAIDHPPRAIDRLPLCIRVNNKTKFLKLLLESKGYVFGPRNYAMWLNYWKVANEPSDDPDSSSSFWEAVGEGDLMEFYFIHEHGPVVKCGIHFLYHHHDNEVHAQLEDLADVSSSSSSSTNANSTLLPNRFCTFSNCCGSSLLPQSKPRKQGWPIHRRRRRFRQKTRNRKESEKIRSSKREADGETEKERTF